MTRDEFLALAGPLLLADEARHNLILGLAGSHPDASFWVVDGAAALRTPPYNLVLAKPRDDTALRALVAAVGDGVPGVTGATPEVFEFADAYGRSWYVVQEHNVFECDAVVPPRATTGAYRESNDDDIELLLDWWEAFIREALPHEEVGPRDPEQIRRRSFGLWEDGGRVVSMCGYGSPTPNGIRIGPVYTPPELRGHGYASAVTAAVTQRQLAAGRTFCFLYTDRANPTANAIYEAIGYRKVCEAAAIAFE